MGSLEIPWWTTCAAAATYLQRKQVREDATIGSRSAEPVGSKRFDGTPGDGATCWLAVWAVGGENMARIWGRGIEEDQTSAVKEEK